MRLAVCNSIKEKNYSGSRELGHIKVGVKIRTTISAGALDQNRSLDTHTYIYILKRNYGQFYPDTHRP